MHNRRLRIVIFAVMTIFSAAFVTMNADWFFARVFWAILRLPTPPASAWYMVDFENRSSHDLLVRVSLVNDREFKSYGVLKRYKRERMGWSGEKERIVLRGDRYLFDIPSSKAPHIGIVLISGHTEVKNPGVKGVSQKLGIKLCAWQSRDKDNRISVHFDDNDLVILNKNLLHEWQGWNFSQLWLGISNE